MEGIMIKKLTSGDDLSHVQELEKKIWGMTPIPIHQTLAIVKNGGLMLGAFFNGAIVGFNYSFVGRQSSEFYLYSHMTGIHPDFRRQGIGFQLKKQQQSEARLMGFSKIKWTYDPLESANACLNLTKLKGVNTTYLDNYYGDLQDNLNNGLPTDRFEVTWWLDHQDITEMDVISNIQKSQYITVVTHNQKENFPVLIDIKPIELWIDAKAVLVPIPADFQGIKEKNFELAMDWRMKTRGIFNTLMEHGFVAVHLLTLNENPLLNYYVFVPLTRL